MFLELDKTPRHDPLQSLPLGIQGSLLNTYLFLNEQSVPSLGGKVQFCYTKDGIQAERALYCLANGF